METPETPASRWENILITGGSGYLGNALVKRIDGKIRIFSRSESLQAKMKEKYPDLDYVLGDVQDYDSVREAVRGMDVVIHAAAMKFLDWAEVNPNECVKTNVIGSMNIIKACLEEGVRICVGCSTDKVPYTRNVYGASKLIMESLFHYANKHGKTNFLIVRYGNVVGSTGSVIPKWIKAKKEGKPIYVTGKKMRRFFMTVDHAVDCILKAMETGKDYIPRDLKAINMWKLAEIIADGKVPVKEMPIRPGEREYEILIPDYEGEQYTTSEAPDLTIEDIKKWKI